jgi:hypothetical protein
VSINNVDTLGRIASLEQFIDTVILVFRVNRDEQLGCATDANSAFSVSKIKLVVDGEEEWFLRPCPNVARVRFPLLPIQTSSSTFIRCVLLQCMCLVRHRERSFTVYKCRTSLLNEFAVAEALYFFPSSTEKVQSPSYNEALLHMADGGCYVAWNLKVYNGSLTCTTHTAVIPTGLYKLENPMSLLAPLPVATDVTDAQEDIEVLPEHTANGEWDFSV